MTDLTNYAAELADLMPLGYTERDPYRDVHEAAGAILASPVLARMLAEAWDQGHRAPKRLGPDDCRCEAWNEDECGCGKYGSNVITPNPYRVYLGESA